MTKVTTLWKYANGHFWLRGNDVLLVSFPRSGSTWLRFLLCNIIALSELSGRPVDFQFLDDTMPEIGYSNLRKEWRFKSIPRCVKTHQNYYPLFFSRPQKTMYILRDPRDVMVSYFHFRQAQINNTYTAEFSRFIRDTRYGLRRCLQHFDSWRERILYLLRYENLKKDPGGELLALLDRMGVKIDEDLLKEAVSRSNLNQVRLAQTRTGLTRKGQFDENFVFARRGTTGEWRSYFSEDDLRFYHELCSEYEFSLYP